MIKQDMAKKVPQKTKDLPATHGMLFEVRDELKKEMQAIQKGIEAGFRRLESEVSDVKSLFHQSMLRFEEQRSENKIVLEALQGLAQRQDRLESEFVQINETVRTLAKTKSPKGRA